MLKLEAIHAVFQAHGIKGVELSTASMDNRSADYRSFKRMSFDLALISTSVTAKGGGGIKQ